jgi:hypothetical protein
MRTRVATLLLCAVTALLLAGCGSKGTTTSTASTASTADWADGVCSAITTWKSSVTSAVDSAQSGTLSKDSLRKAADQVDSATKTFTDTVKGLGKPNTKAGAQAKQLLDDLSAQIDTERKKIDDAIGGATSVSAILSAAPVVLGSLQAMGTDVTNTFKQLRALDASGELSTAFDESSACKTLTKSS